MKTKLILGNLLTLAMLSMEAQNASYRLNNGLVTGVNNSAFGWNSINNTTTGADNSACGFRALNANTIGNRNSGIGSRVLVFNTSGNDNSAIGHNALYSNTSGSYNTANGSGAMYLNTTGTYNTAIGYQADVGASGLTNATAIGANAIVNTSYAIQLGDGNVTQIFGGVNNNATFISGGLQITGGSPASGKVLTSDPAGVATWQAITASGLGAWSTTGNAGTVDGTNFIGTTDNVPLNFKVNNQKAGRVDDATENTFFGYLSGNASISTGSLNSAFGHQSLTNNTNGVANCAFGTSALKQNTTSSGNSAFGFQAFLNSIGAHNTGVGTNCYVYSTTGEENTGLGSGSGIGNTTGSRNTSIGYWALRHNVSGNDNTGVGYKANAVNVNNGTAIGANATVLVSNAIQLGDGNVTQVFAGTGVTATVITGGLKVTGGTPALGKVLTSDAAGNATWQTPSGGSGGWSLNGNLGTTSANFIGTTDNMPLNFKYNSQRVGKLDANNVVFGYEAGNNLTGTYNVLIGYRCGFSNTNGVQNAAYGRESLYSNVGGHNNSSFGYWSMYSGLNASENVGFGSHTLFYSTAGQNTGCGYAAGFWNGSGSSNTALGYFADFSSQNFTNASAIGAQAITNASNKIVIGNTAASMVIGGYATAGWSSLSDGRFKENVVEEVPGLDFIVKLRPVSYTINTKKLDEHLMQNMPDSIKKLRMQTPEEYAKASDLVSIGFIAQEVEKTVNELGVHFDGVNAPKNSTDNYSIGYAKFVVPLVKAVQEQQAIIEQQKQANQKQQEQIDELKAMVSSLLTKTGLESKTTTTRNNAVELSDKNVVVLNQNVPNPFAESTVITYNIPSDFAKAQILFSTSEGKVIRVVNITEKGEGNLSVFANDLTNGFYTYTLVIDGKTIDAKKMIKE